MSSLASSQLLIFWGAVWLGAQLAAVYALPAALRAELPLSRLLESLLDLLYFAVAGFISFLYLLSTVEGRLRGFVLLGELLGALLLRLTLYPVLLAVLSRLLRLVKGLMRWVGRIGSRMGGFVRRWLPEQPDLEGEDGNFSEETTKSP